MSSKAILIGGLPATKFVGRQIKVKWGDGSPHPSACKCVGTDKGDIVVALAGSAGHSPRTFRVAPSCCRPWWAQNPDLKVEADSIGVSYSGEVSVGRAFEKACAPKPVKQHTPAKKPAKAVPVVEVIPPAPVKPIAEVIPPTPMSPPINPIKTKPPAPTPVSPRKATRMDVPIDGDGAWVNDAQEYYRVRTALTTNEELLAKLTRTVEEDRVMLELLMEQLESHGVVFRHDQGAEAPERRFRGKATSSSAHRIREWMRQAEEAFGYADVFTAAGCAGTHPLRLQVRDFADELGIAYSVTYGRKILFVPQPSSMIKHTNALRLAREASRNVIQGGASALYKAKRLERMGGGWEVAQIVNRVYTHPHGTATYECRECGQEYVAPEEASACCAEEE